MAGRVSRASRPFLSVTSWFFHPEIDMLWGWEVLSRGSAALLHVSPSASPSPPSLPPRLVAAASHHVTHPHRFPRYYPREEFGFLEALGDEHVRHTVEVREEGTGKILAWAPVGGGDEEGQEEGDGEGRRSRVLLRAPAFGRSPIVGHPTRDVSLLPLDAATERRLWAGADAAGVPLRALRLARTRPHEATALTFFGHFLRASGTGAGKGAGAGASSSTLLPRTISGKLLLRSPQQVFARTSEVLEMGMCGGPVTTSAGEEDEACVGVVEGIVAVSGGDAGGEGASVGAPSSSSPSPSPRQAKKLLSGCAVFVECDTLESFAREVLSGDDGGADADGGDSVAEAALRARGRGGGLGGGTGEEVPPWPPTVIV
jgi:hypothetical protein